jgi:hypothetical protein
MAASTRGGYRSGRDQSIGRKGSLKSSSMNVESDERKKNRYNRAVSPYWSGWVNGLASRSASPTMVL